MRDYMLLFGVRTCKAYEGTNPLLYADKYVAWMMDGNSQQGTNGPGTTPTVLAPKYQDPEELKTYFSDALPANNPAELWGKVFSAHSSANVVTINNRGITGIPLTFPTLCFRISNSHSEGAIAWLRWKHIASTDDEVQYNIGNVTDESAWHDIASNNAINDKYLALNNGLTALPQAIAGHAKMQKVSAPDPILGWTGGTACIDCDEGELRNVKVTVFH